MKIKSVTKYICPICEKLYDKVGGAAECCRIERFWRSKWETIFPGDAIYVEKKDGSSFIVTFRETKILEDMLLVLTTHDSSSGLRFNAYDMRDKTIRLATHKEEETMRVATHRK